MKKREPIEFFGGVKQACQALRNAGYPCSPNQVCGDKDGLLSEVLARRFCEVTMGKLPYKPELYRFRKARMNLLVGSKKSAA